LFDAVSLFWDYQVRPLRRPYNSPGSLAAFNWLGLGKHSVNSPKIPDVFQECQGLIDPFLWHYADYHATDQALEGVFSKFWLTKTG